MDKGVIIISIVGFYFFALIILYKIMSTEDKNIKIKSNKNIKIRSEEKSNDEITANTTLTNNVYMLSGRTSDILKYCQKIDCKLNDTKDRCIYTENNFTYGCPPECIETETNCKTIQ